MADKGLVPGAEPLLGIGGRGSLSERGTIALLFGCKLVCGVASQSILVFAPFLAQASGGMSLAEYRLSLLAADLASVVPAMLPLDGGSARALGGASMMTLAVSMLLPQAMPGILPLIALRFLTGAAYSVMGIVSGAVLSGVADGRRTSAIAMVEVSWFIASFVVPLFGAVLDAYGAMLALVVMVGAPGAVLAVLAFRLLPATPERGPKEEPGSPTKAGPVEGSASVAWRLGHLLSWSVLSGCSSCIFMVRYGAWLHEAFGMSATDLGLFSNAIALGNLTGNLVTQLIGSTNLPVRCVATVSTLGLALMSLTLMLLPVVVPVYLLFVLVFLYFLMWECAFLTSFSYATQLSKRSQMKGLSLFFALLSVGKVTGDWLAPFPSMTSVFGGGAAAYLLAAGVLTRQTAEPEAVAPSPMTSQDLAEGA